MGATIQLRKGDMFAQPTDLIIIPCSTGPTIARRVAERLVDFDISPPREPMNLGAVKFNLFEGASSIATYVGYAASVRAMESNLSAIKKIGSRIARFVRDKPEIRDVSLPLLGSGAGGIPPRHSVNALVKGLESISVNDKVYNIFIYKEEDYIMLTESDQASPPLLNREAKIKEKERDKSIKTREPVRVFISYTKTNIDHQEWVRDIAVFLRKNGIDARLDVWHLRPGMDLPQWMCNELDLADRVLIICNKDYAARADGRLGGVGWEIRLVQGDLLQNQAINPNKYIPIIRGSQNDGVPKFLKGAYCIPWPDKEDRQLKKNLLRELYEAYEEAPPLGSPPRYVLQ